MDSFKLPLPSFLSIILVQLLRLLLLSSSSASTTAYPDFQQLNVLQSIKQTRLLHHSKLVDDTSSNDEQQFELVLSTLSSSLDHHHQQEHHNTTSTTHPNHHPPLKLNLIHRDKLPTTISTTNHTHRFLHRLHRDTQRFTFLTHLLTPASSTQTPQKLYSPTTFSSDIISGMDQGSGEYFIRIGIGSPPKPQYMVIDSGSDLIWIQSQPCNPCYPQSDPLFNPLKSTSFIPIPCPTPLCHQLQTSTCSTDHTCLYSILYNDGSYSKGTLALETLTIGSTRVRNLAIGCGHRNRGMFVAASGLIGLGGGSMSLVGQLNGQSGGAFTYCLVSRGGSSSSSESKSSTGYLVFGRESLPVGAAWVNLVRNPQAPTFYYVELSGLGVGGTRVEIPESVFVMTDSGDGGVVMDTGTAVTRFPEEAYVALRDMFVEQTVHLPRGMGLSIFDTCYDLSGFVSVRVPTVSFYFKEGDVLTLPARNFLIPVDDKGTFCFAFASSGSRLSIFGNIQQEGIQISIDGSNGFLGFGPNVC